MRSIWRSLKALYSGPFQSTLVFSFTLVAALTIALGSWVISKTITAYLAGAMDERVAQDIRCARLFYTTRQEGLTHTASQLVLSNTILNLFEDAQEGDRKALDQVDQKLLTAINDDSFKGNRSAVLLDREGRVITGLVIDGDLNNQRISSGADWSEFNPVGTVLGSGLTISATEVIPVAILEDSGLADQAEIDLVNTPMAATELYDDREGSAGFGLVSAAPVYLEDELVGAVVVFHLINNDFTLVDSIKTSTEIDTVTIFFGDLRISTNVMTESGERAVGTRVSEEVNEIVLQQGEEYVGNAFVVNENYITRYEPLRDHQGNVVGILYVGARQQAFEDFLNTFRRRVALVALVTILLTFILATPVSRVITRPLKDLQALADTSRQVAAGDLNARAPATAGGEVGLLAESFNDMLDTLQATQKQLFQSEKLASLGQLSAGIAHELNNPLATVLLLSDLLRKENSLSEETRKDVEIIVSETKRCRGIVSSLLDFARQHQVEAQEIDLNQLINQVVDTECRHNRYRNVDIVLELEPDLPRIQADPDQIQAVIINLLTNAVDAMPERGDISIRTREVSANQVQLEIEDEGQGVSSHDQDKLFTPFFTTKPVGEGTGLGLSIVYGIIKMHRGHIHFRSHPGEGTVFTINLPTRLPGFGAENNNFTLGPDHQT
jgi:two-component system NtrC family sensor kinase